MNWYCINCWRKGEARDLEEAAIFHYADVINDIHRVPNGLTLVGCPDDWIQIKDVECIGDIRLGIKKESQKENRPSMLLLFESD